MSVAFCCQVPAIFKWMGKFRQTFEPAFAGDVELLLEQEDWSTLTVWSLRHHSTCISTISWWGSQVEDHIGWSVKTGWKQKGKATRYAFSSSAASIIQASMSTDWYHVITHTHTCTTCVMHKSIHPSCRACPEMVCGFQCQGYMRNGTWWPAPIPSTT